MVAHHCAAVVRKEVIHMSCPDVNCRKGGCTTEPQAPQSGSTKR